MVDTKSRPYLQTLMARAGGRPDVRFVVSPQDDELLSLYQRCWAVVFPPLNEDWGLVPLEAMACAKPVLATDRGGPRESVVDGETGFLRDDHPEAFAAAIRRLVDMPEPELDLMSAQARLRALDFPWSSFVHRIDDHVDQLSGPRLVADRAAMIGAL
jgi:glycosyltransferase involved in cell wall biosynthesis